MISSSDSYHTCYVLAGLSSAQHKWRFNSTGIKETSDGGLVSPYQWTSEAAPRERHIYDDEDRVKTVHPVFVIPEGVADATRAYFVAKRGSWE